MIKSIVFDFGGVISPGVTLHSMKKLDKNDPKYIKFLQDSHKWDIGEMTEDEFYSALEKFAGIPAKDIPTKYYEKATFDQAVVDLIKKLKKQYKIVLFSNNFRNHLVNYLNKLDINSLFDKIVVSSDHKMIKPDPAFYQKLLDTINLTSNEVVFIDDSKANVDAGNILGIKSFLFTDAETLKNDLKNTGIEI